MRVLYRMNQIQTFNKTKVSPLLKSLTTKVYLTHRSFVQTVESLL